MRCNLHVHTRHSGMCTIPGLSTVCRESYNDPEAVYRRLKRLGMDLVTVADHDSIDAAESLRRHADFLLSEEVTCRLPSGTELHVGVYDITDRDHAQLQCRQADCFAEHFPALETHNAHMLRAANRGASGLAREMAKAEVGGSDAHAMPSVGCVWTAVSSARTKQGYLEGLRYGRGRVRGENGSAWKLTRDVLAIGAAMARERLVAAVLALLALARCARAKGTAARAGAEPAGGVA